MKKHLLFVVFLSFAYSLSAQDTLWAQSDFIVLKKKSGRLIKTYFPGSFISAITYNGFEVNGYITEIRNDSIYVKQQETRLVGAQFGSVLDTLLYTIGFDYRQLQQFNFSNHFVQGGYSPGATHGFAQVTLPALMMIGGGGFLVLELVNTAYRKETITANNKLPSLMVAAGVLGAGILLKAVQKNKYKVGVRYKVEYIKKGTRE